MLWTRDVSIPMSAMLTTFLRLIRGSQCRVKDALAALDNDADAGNTDRLHLLTY
jgi:hypothetical protein